jgi:S-adenosylmethionine-dependent methyltransferase
MPDDIRDIIAYYDISLESENARLERHQLEHDLTWRYLRRNLPAQGAILEVGAATGAYTVDLARLGYTVTAVDLSAVLLEKCRRRLAEAGLEQQVRLALADARDLRLVEKQSFDAALLMGPLYHLVLEDDRRAAMREVYERLKPGGLIFSTFISRYGVLADLLKKMPAWIESRAEARSHLERGKRPDDQPPGGFRGYFARLAEIAPLHEALGFQTIALAGVEPCIAADDESYNHLAGEQRELWLDLFDELSTEPTIIGASRHLLYVGRKL